jgi:hypothetical protein
MKNTTKLINALVNALVAEYAAARANLATIGTPDEVRTYALYCAAVRRARAARLDLERACPDRYAFCDAWGTAYTRAVKINDAVKGGNLTRPAR